MALQKRGFSILRTFECHMIYTIRVTTIPSKTVIVTNIFIYNKLISCWSHIGPMLTIIIMPNAIWRYGRTPLFLFTTGVGDVTYLHLRWCSGKFIVWIIVTIRIYIYFFLYEQRKYNIKVLQFPYVFV